jgi:hypothetical protein
MKKKYQQQPFLNFFVLNSSHCFFFWWKAIIIKKDFESFHIIPKETDNLLSSLMVFVHSGYGGYELKLKIGNIYLSIYLMWSGPLLARLFHCTLLSMDFTILCGLCEINFVCDVSDNNSFWLPSRAICGGIIVFSYIC